MTYTLCVADMAFRDDSYGICERLEFVSCLKAYYVSLNRLKWNEVQVSDMQFMQQELAFVTNEVCQCSAPAQACAYAYITVGDNMPDASKALMI